MEPTFIYHGISDNRLDVQPSSKGLQKVCRGNPPSFARRQNCGTGILGVTKDKEGDSWKSPFNMQKIQESLYFFRKERIMGLLHEEGVRYEVF